MMDASRATSVVSREDMKAVRRGAALLDDKVPGWRDRVDPDRLKMAICRECIVGQALRLGKNPEEEYTRHLQEWFGVTYDDALDEREEEFGFSARSVFGFDALKQAWVTYLRGDWS